MKIIIVGAGQVGGTLAEHLASEKNDITLIDKDSNRLRELQDRLDIGTVSGHGSHPGVLARAGAEDAEMLIAVTNSDEVNMIACQVAHTLFRTPTRIARIRSHSYTQKSALFCKEAIPIDVIISPEQLVTNAVERLIDLPGSLQVLDFAEGRVGLVGVKALHGAPMVGQQLSEIRKRMPKADTRVAAIFRRNRPIIPEGNTVIEANDDVFFIAAREHILQVMAEMRGVDKPYKRVMIAGGGNIGMRLAETIEARYNVKVIEMHPERCNLLSERLNHGIALKGSASDRDLLISANIQDTDVFCALTNDDEINIMSSLLAKRLGATKVITLIGNPAYVDLVQGVDIDIAVSPQLVTIGSLLTHVRRGHMTNVYRLRRGAAEALEIVAHGDASNSKVVGRTLGEIKLPEGATIGAIVRGDKVLIAHRHVLVESGDHVILFLVDKGRTREVEKLFQVGFSFF
ncbi:MAG: Trk system potassium transporter TrkA [Pseudomonadales bacterium]|nr:Trk system potassium transporter TrkA [Pseudomonadales bacterium]